MNEAGQGENLVYDWTVLNRWVNVSAVCHQDTVYYAECSQQETKIYTFYINTVKSFQYSNKTNNGNFNFLQHKTITEFLGDIKRNKSLK